MEINLSYGIVHFLNNVSNFNMECTVEFPSDAASVECPELMCTINNTVHKDSWSGLRLPGCRNVMCTINNTVHKDSWSGLRLPGCRNVMRTVNNTVHG